jgi:hypothetical protein
VPNIKLLLFYLVCLLDNFFNKVKSMSCAQKKINFLGLGEKVRKSIREAGSTCVRVEMGKASDL